MKTHLEKHVYNAGEDQRTFLVQLETWVIV